MKSPRVDAYFKTHPEYAQEALSLIEANRGPPVFVKPTFFASRQAIAGPVFTSSTETTFSSMGRMVGGVASRAAEQALRMQH